MRNRVREKEIERKGERLPKGELLFPRGNCVFLLLLLPSLQLI
jgi:hypothetical protein